MFYTDFCFDYLSEVASETFIIYYIIFIATGEPQTNYKNLEKVKDTMCLLVVVGF